jgi:predicted N-formylglutamate amidohydrolase
MSEPFVIVCDHATNFVPPELHNLGVFEADLSRHIGWDIGAAAIAKILADRFNAPLTCGHVSRLVIDCNRQLDAFDLIPEVSDGTPIPGNQNLSREAKEDRISRYFRAYHDAVERTLGGREDKIFLSVHSMTDRMKGIFRPWPIALSSGEDRTLVEPMLTVLRASGEFEVGDNQPYNLDPKVDYSTPYHAIRRGMRHLQVEFRQDQITQEAGQKLWAGRFADALVKAGLT